MKEKINKELARLQKELQGLENATSQIKKAESIATEVTKSVKGIQTQYIKHLEDLKTQTKNILDQNSESSKKLIKELSENSKMNINKLSENSHKNIKQLTDSHKKEIKKTNNELLELKKEISESNTINTNQIKQLAEETHKNQVELSSSHEKQMAEVNKLLESYLDLAQSTGKLSERIGNVNFPERLDKITINTGEIQTQIRQLQSNVQTMRSDTRLDVLTKKMKKNTRRTNVVILLGVLSFIMLLFTSYALMVKYLPQMDYLRVFLQNP